MTDYFDFCLVKWVFTIAIYPSITVRDIVNIYIPEASLNLCLLEIIFMKVLVVFLEATILCINQSIAVGEIWKDTTY